MQQAVPAKTRSIPTGVPDRSTAIAVAAEFGTHNAIDAGEGTAINVTDFLTRCTALANCNLNTIIPPPISSIENAEMVENFPRKKVGFC